MTGGRDFSVPEPHAEISRGFLTDYWQYDKPLPKIEGPRVISYYLRRGLQMVLVLPLSNVITITTIATSLFLLSGFMLLLLNTGALIARVGNTLSLTLYLKDGASVSAVDSLIVDLKANPKVRAVQHISKDEALRMFREDLGSRSGFLAGLAEDNPLPASVEVELQPDQIGMANVESFVESLRGNVLIDDIVYGSQWVERMEGVLKMFRYVGLAAFLIVLSVVVFLMANTIKLAIYSRREEVSIMKLVGASDRFIKIPFMICGVIQGLFGSLIGLLLLGLAFIFFDRQMSSSRMFDLTLPQLAFLDYKEMLLVVVVGIVVGAVGSLFALGKFIGV